MYTEKSLTVKDNLYQDKAGCMSVMIFGPLASGLQKTYIFVSFTGTSSSTAFDVKGDEGHTTNISSVLQFIFTSRKLCE